MLDGELAKHLEDAFLNHLLVLIGGIGGVGNDDGRKVGAVYRIMDGHGDLELSVVVDDCTRNTSPHGLKGSICVRDEEGGAR